MNLLNIKIVDGQVKEVWDNPPPEGEEGWVQAVEVYPELIPHRQIYNGHTFDLTKDPVEIVWAVRDVSVEERRDSLKGHAAFLFKEVVKKEMDKEVDNFPETQYNAGTVDAARIEFENKVNALDACTTHEELDALL
jgi:hypothetical protein